MANLAPTSANLGSTWAHLELTWAKLGPTSANLGTTWCELEPTWGYLGPTWVQLRPPTAFCIRLCIRKTIFSPGRGAKTLIFVIFRVPIAALAPSHHCIFVGTNKNDENDCFDPQPEKKMVFSEAKSDAKCCVWPKLAPSWHQVGPS